MGTAATRGLSGPTVSEARLASVLGTAPDGIVVVDEAGTVLTYNAAAERMFGRAARDVIGRNVTLLMPEEFAALEGGDLSRYLSSGFRRFIGHSREVRARHADGTVFPIELSVGEARTPEGRQFIGIMRDSRPRKEAERRLNQLQADLVHIARVSAIDEMGAVLAHELNQPLTAITLYLQAIRRSAAKNQTPDLPDATREILGKALREAERAAAIIQRMRSFVEKREPERAPSDVQALVDEAVELTLLGHRPHVRIERVRAEDVPALAVDAVQIQQVVVNIMRNALDAVRRSPDPCVRVASWAEREFVLVAITDSGPGIAPDVLPNLFRAFNTTKRSGLGLGLSISKTIAQNHGGDLWVDPGGEGRGATFTLQLPAP
jgi:two-component system sensor kinase FixL